MPIGKQSHVGPPPETVELRKQLASFLSQRVPNNFTGSNDVLGNYKFGVYAFYDYDGEPIYIGQTNERLRVRIRRHLTNQRTDAVAMSVLDPFEVCDIEVWPLPNYQTSDKNNFMARQHLDWLEYQIFQSCLKRSHFNAVLNEKDPPDTSNRILPSGKRIAECNFQMPSSTRACIVTKDMLTIRRHPDTRIARRASTLATLAKVISERQVRHGLRRTLLTQAKRLAWLAETRLDDLGNNDVSESDESED